MQVIREKKEGKKHCNLLSSRDGLKWPNSISYREIDDTLIVGCGDSDYVFLFKLGTKIKSFEISGNILRNQNFLFV